MITKARIIQEAKELGCLPAALKAVDMTESAGNGFLEDGVTPKILFEPHIFWRELRKKGIDPSVYAKNPRYASIVYLTWGSKPYGKTSAQHGRMQLAAEIDREAALMSASWGRYQVLGNNWKACSCKSLQDFINKMYRSEDDHLDMFTEYVKSNFLDDELRALDWLSFARGYNGPFYWKNKYDFKLANNFRIARAEFK